VCCAQSLLMRSYILIKARVELREGILLAKDTEHHISKDEPLQGLTHDWLVFAGYSIIPGLTAGW